MTVSHIFFDLHGVLVNRAEFGREYRVNLGRIMAQRYGRPEAEWSAAYGRVLADWDSYYADLNLSGDEGIADMWEGLFRTTRALFRLTGTAEPSKSELATLSRELPRLASQGCDALYADVPDVVRALDEAGLVLGVISYSLSGVIEGLVAPIRAHFKGEISGIDQAERFEKDVQRYQVAALRAQVAPGACLVVDDDAHVLRQAEEAGMQTIRVARYAALPHPYPRDLYGVVERCMQANPDRRQS